MRPNITKPRATTACLIACLAAIAIATAAETPVPYPDGFRFVDRREVAGRRPSPRIVSQPRRTPSLLREREGRRRISHRDVSRRRNRGRRSRVHEGGRGTATGLLLEGERRFLDVMVKDAQRYKSTGGWGYDHFDRDDKTSRLTDAERGTCAACHAKAPADHVFSHIRP